MALILYSEGTTLSLDRQKLRIVKATIKQAKTAVKIWHKYLEILRVRLNVIILGIVPVVRNQHKAIDLASLCHDSLP
jgi:hypothetical protein